MRSGVRVVVRVEFAGGCLHLVEQAGHPPMVGLEPVHDLAHARGGPAYRREQHCVLEAVVRMHESAVTEAIGAQLEQGPSRLQRLDPGPDLARRSPTRHVRRELPARLKVAADEAVHPLQLFEQDVARFVDSFHHLLARRHRLDSTGSNPLLGRRRPLVAQPIVEPAQQTAVVLGREPAVVVGDDVVDLTGARAVAVEMGAFRGRRARSLVAWRR